MQRRNNTLVFVILAGVALIILVLAFSVGEGDVPSPTPSSTEPPTKPSNIFFPPGVEGALTPAQQAAFERLRTESKVEPSLRVEKGVVRFSTMVVPIPPSKGTTTSEKAYAFLNDFADLYNLSSPSQTLQLIETESDEQGNEQAVFSQAINDIPVYLALIRVYLNSSGEVTSVNGAYLPGEVPPSTPTISAEQAQSIAAQSLGVDDPVFLVPPTLFYFDEAVFGESASLPRLVWHVDLSSIQAGGEWISLIDAMTGEIVRQFSPFQHLTREVWDNHNNLFYKVDGATQVMVESGCLPDQNCDKDAQAAYDHAGEYYRYLLKTFERKGYDDKEDTIMKSYVHATFPYGLGRNAAWWNGAVYYSDGFSGAADVVYHEWTHGLILIESTLKEEGRPPQFAALEESYADVFAVLIDNDDWLLGEDLPRSFLDLIVREFQLCRAYRDLSDPTKCGGVDHMSKYNKNNDEYSNAGIPNKAAYLLMQTKKLNFNNISVQGIGRDKVARIYYETITRYLNPAWQFRDARDWTIKSCIDLIGKHEILFEDCLQVVNAFSAVGIEGSSRFPSTPPSPVSGSSTILVFDSSGSMNDQDASGVTKLIAAKTAGQSILDVIKAENEVADSGIAQVGLVDFNFLPNVDASLSMDISIAETALQNMYADGGTGMPDGLKTALDLFPQTAADAKLVLILLSDGVANVGHGNDQSLSPDQVKAQVLAQAKRAKQMGVCIYTVGFGVPGGIGSFSGDTSIDEELLKQIPATAGCGSYYNAQNAVQLTNVYVELRHTSTGNVLLKQEGSIAQGQRVDIGSAQVPANQSLLLLTLNWPGSRLDPLLYDPGGRQVDANYPGASIFLSQTMANIVIEKPRAGQWQVAAMGADIPQGTTTYHAILSARPSAVPPSSSFGPAILVVILALVSGGVVIYTLRHKPGAKGPLAGSPGAAVASLTGIAGSMAGISTQIPPTGLLIGRGSECTLRLADRAASRQHARLAFAQGNWYLQDLGSRGGTYVNGIRVNAIGLKEGDHIRIGNSEFIFRYHTVPRSASK